MSRLSSKLRLIETSHGPGVAFWCPGCNEMHAISIAPNSRGDGWTFDGNVDAPTFSPSIKVDGVERLSEAEYQRVLAHERVEKRPTVCHSFIRAGRIEFLGDCTHALRSQAVTLPDFQDSEETD